MVEANIKIISALKAFLELSSSDLELKRCFIENPTDFTRQRKLTYQRTVFLLINMLILSLLNIYN